MKNYYSKEVIRHFMKPNNMGKLKNYNGKGTTENLRCGDSMRIYIKVEKNRIQDIGFETLGCAAAVSTSDMICDLAKGKTLEKAKKISFQNVAKKLGSLPKQKLHCANLAEHALQQAIQDFERSKK